MQKRLSARSSGVVESPRSGGGSDSELSPCADDTDERLQKKSLLAGITSRFRHNGICRSVGTLHRHRMSLRSGFNPETKQRTLDALRWGLIPNWAKDPKIAYKTINARAETVDTAPSYRQAFKKRRCLIPERRFLRMEKSRRRKDPILDQHEGRFTIRVRRVMGRLERSRERRMAAHLHDHHRRTKRVCAGDPHPDAGHPTGRASRCLVIR